MIVLIQQVSNVTGTIVGAISVVTVLITSSIISTTLINICMHIMPSALCTILTILTLLPTNTSMIVTMEAVTNFASAEITSKSVVADLSTA